MPKKAELSLRHQRGLMGLSPVLALAAACGSTGEAGDAAPSVDDFMSEIGQAKLALEVAEGNGCVRAGREIKTARIKTSQGVRDVSFCHLTTDTVLFDGDVVVSAEYFDQVKEPLPSAGPGWHIPLDSIGISVRPPSAGSKAGYLEQPAAQPGAIGSLFGNADKIGATKFPRESLKGAREAPVATRVGQSEPTPPDPPRPPRPPQEAGGVRSGGDLRWPDGGIPFQIQIAGTVEEQDRLRSRIMEAIGAWQQSTPFRFVPRTDQVDFVEFVPVRGSICMSALGRQGKRQEIVVGDGCLVGNVMHEIGHAVGFFHEHNRSDRDEHIRLDANCVKTNDFSMADGSNLGPYDYLSIMHYPKQADPSDCEITPLTPGALIGQRTELSVGDILGAHQLRFGSRPTLRPVPADYDGDVRTDMSLKDDLGVWRIDFASGGFGDWDRRFPEYGFADVIPVPADYDGDGRADLSVKRTDGWWFIDYASDSFGNWNLQVAGYGLANVVPVPADYDGDRRADLSIKRNDGTWLIDYASDGFNGWNETFSGYGGADVTPVPADYDGDRRADLSIRRSDGTWLIDYASDGFNVVMLNRASFWNETVNDYSGADVTPVPADYDGDGKADLSVKENSGAALWKIDYAKNGFGGWEVRRVVGA